MEGVPLTENRTLMTQAREALRGKWPLAVGTSAVYTVILVVAQKTPYIGFVLYLLIFGPMLLGWAVFTLSLSRRQEAKFDQLFDGFNRLGKAMGTYLLMVLFILLWMLLLIVPGIIAGLAYSQTFYILAEDSSMSPLAAIRKSKEMMRGRKGKLFCLGLRFLGWGVLCIFTLGLGLLWLVPYTAVTMAAFYDDLSRPEQTAEQQVAV